LIQRLKKSEDELLVANGQAKLYKESLEKVEEENQSLKNTLALVQGELQKLKIQNDDFKSRANIGMIDCLELDLKREKEFVADLRAKLDDKQNEYTRKLKTYTERFEEYRARINELEEYRVKYEELKGSNDLGFSDEDIKNEYEK
jgi:chromosome segregation ATPase